jgi:hypothetical protein
MANRSLGGALLHRRASAPSLGLLRIWIFGIWLVYVAIDPVQVLSRLPSEAFAAPGALGILPQSIWPLVLSETGLLTLKLVTLAGIVLVLVGALPSRLLTVSVTALLVIYQGVLRGFSGHMNHAELVLLYATGIVALFPCFDALSLRRSTSGTRKQSLYSAPFVAIAFVFCLSFSFVGAARLGNGLSLFFTDTLRNLTIENWLEMGSMTGDRFATPLGPMLALEIFPSLIFQLAYLASTLLELLAPLALISRWFRYLFVGFAATFHAVNLLVLGVPFIENMFLLVVFSERWFHAIAIALDRGAWMRRLSRSATGTVEGVAGEPGT